MAIATAWGWSRSGLLTGLRRLEDGRVLYSRIEDGRARLVIRDSSGAEIRSIDLGVAARVATGDLLMGQQVVAATATAKDSWKESSLFVVDLVSGQAKKVADDLVPAMDGYWYSQRVSDGKGLYTSLVDEHEVLVAFNALTGERKHGAGRR